ncbi:ornithine cyclodeaminase family protein [Umezawaea tangerina]|uniref:Ornithine cyclodeaminase n=1 Tax=Umezawaea tangerina TaxID=84725 RepID=A0A2T0SX09_9PSEU|nr:ornithine cyclodeaminase family protein [Umezawaea tangerina]PRY37929.1 ornithine cyclodeaminase [Umezawaea tangerina]
MRFLSETESAALVTEELAYDAVRAALVAAVDPASTTFPALPAHGSLPHNRFTMKSASAHDVAGVKIGSYWPDNTDIPRHNSTILLIDQETGRIAAVVEAGTVNAYRTAAADAVAADTLARQDATTLTVFGTGHQARYECTAVARIRPIDTVHVVARTPAHGADMVEHLAAKGLKATVTPAEEAVRAADIVVTATTARSPLFDAAWVRPGTHLASMGSDARGKQELPPALLATAALFCDLPAQSTTIGEFQHALARPVTALGDVLAGRAPGRHDDDTVTVFDSSGIALQDLYVATALLALSRT